MLVYFNSKQIVLGILDCKFKYCSTMSSLVSKSPVHFQCLLQIRHYPRFQHLHKIQDQIHIRTFPYMVSERTHICMEERIFCFCNFVCNVYQQSRKNRMLTKLADLRWWFYSQKQSQGGNMPPTAAALRPAIRRCHYQCMEWFRDIEQHPNLPSPLSYGWIMENKTYEPVLCDLPCAPEEVLDLVKCSCKSGRCVPPCKCASVHLPCTEMCGCGSDPEFCANVGTEDSDESEEDIENELDF